MSFNTALSSPQLTKIRRKSWQGNQLLSFCDNVIAFHALVASNLNSVGGSTTEAVPYTGVIAGAYTNIDQDMTVIISPNSDIRNPLAVRGRVNYQVADGTNVYVKEFSDPISSGAHLWVLYHYDVLDVLSRPVGTNPVIQYKDYNRSFQRMAPVIVGLQTGYAGWVDGSGNFDIPFDASASFAAESGRTITGYQYSVKATGSGSASVIAGAANTATVTYRFTAGEYWLKLVVTDSGSVTQFRHVLIKAHNRTNYLPQTGFDEVEITRDVQGGPSARVKGYNGVSTLINGTIVIIWVDELYSDSDFSNPSTTPIFNNIDMVGWIEAEENNYQTDLKYSALIDVSFEVQGVGARLARLEGQLLAFKNNASPSVWDEINNLTPWRAIVHFLQRHTTVLNLCDFTADDVTNTFLFPTIVTLAGRALDNLTGNQGIAEEINAQLEFASDGRIQLIRREPFVFSNLGHTPLTIATWVSGQDFHTALKWKFRHDVQYGYLSADGAFWDGSAAPVVPLLARAPGLAQASGADQGKLNNQILASTSSPTAAQGELSARAGVQYAMDNNTMELTCNHPAGYHWLQASYNQLYIWSLDSTFNIRGLSLDAGTSWMIKSVTVRHNNKEGDREVTASYIPVRTGTPAAPVPVVNPSNDVPALPVLPPMPAFPDIEYPEVTIPDVGLTSAQITPTGTKTTLNGEILFAATAVKAYVLRQFITLTKPAFQDITPSDLGTYQIQAVAVSPFLTATAIPGWILAYDSGTDKSAIWYSPNINAGLNNVSWSKGADISGHYTVLRATSTNGTILVYSPSATGSGSWTETLDFTGGNSHGFSAKIFTCDPPDYGGFTYITAPTGWYGQEFDNNAVCGAPPGTFTTSKCDFSRTFPFSFHCTSIRIQGRTPTNAAYGATFIAVNSTNYGVTLSPDPYDQTVSPNMDNVNYIRVALGLGRDNPPPVLNHDITVESMIIVGTGLNPFGGSSDATIVPSTDNGATWGTPQDNGPTPGLVGGFDGQSEGTVSYAAASGKVRKATTLGGTYSDWFAVPGGANPVCIIVPWFRRNSTTINTGVSDPDVIAACTDGKLYWINGTAATSTDITPTGMNEFDHENCVTVSYGHHLAVFGKVSGHYHLFTSTNGGTSWTDRGELTSPTFLRDRRRDDRAVTSGTNKGQLYLASDSNMAYSSVWASGAGSVAGLWPRTMPSTPIVTFDPVY